ncbi:hypothetical protein DQ384_28280 [Sphaerisporangium album]|uniref:Uncharacterized protein n=1 Tax=Sphaerisporangium album TaxID=509200 RepID=A0A367F8W9_9ACTN|nr:hypothetical protein [Sphaerisporangium album]RCG26794.1 hypothetical protein DQ384_28280 [Sphaerisporangium album]
MSERLDALEERINALRAEVRRAVRARDGALARSLRAELRGVERAWDQALADQEPPARETPSASEPDEAPRAGAAREPGALVPVREQVHQALTILGVPASAKMIVAVHGALRAGSLRGTQLASLRRDEERSFRSSPFARPYYLCAALTDRLSASRGLLTVSTWPLERRAIGPLSPRVDFLTTAIRVAEHILRLEEAGEPTPSGAERLLSRLAYNVPGVPVAPDAPPRPAMVVKAARAELEVHAGADADARARIADRARARLGDAERLFGGTILSLAREEAS